MQLAQRTLAQFTAHGYNTTEPQPYFINECCFGDDVARALMQNLNAAGVATDPEPGQEDFGWYFGYVINDVPYACVLGNVEDEETADTWLCWIERPCGCLQTLLGGRKKRIELDAVIAMDKAIRALPGFEKLEWHEQARFQRNDYSSASPTP